MKYTPLLSAAGLALALSLAGQAHAASDADDDYAKRAALSQQIKKMRAMRKELPIPPASGLFGVYAFPEKGQFVTGINFQNYRFSGLLQGSDSISQEAAVTSVPNRFFGDPGQPPTLRVVPESAEANVMFPYINYAVSQKFALVALAPIVKKETVLETYQGGGGSNSLGTNTVTSEGLGDIKAGFIYKAFNTEQRKHNLLFDVVLSLPTGSIEESDMSLTPMNTMVDARLGYGMQLGSGTFDALLGISYWGRVKKVGWGAQYLGTIPLESENSEGWRYGDKHEFTAWTSYSWKPTLVGSFRLRHEYQGEIEGSDPKIYGPGLGADPDNYGGTKTEALIGVNWMYKPARNISIEYANPFAQDRNGIQAEHDQTIMISWRNAFF